MLHRELTSYNLTITKLNLIYNGLTESCSPAIISIIISCRVKELLIDDNNINICESEKFISFVSDPSSTLVRLSSINTKLSSLGAINLFIALSKVTCKLTYVNISWNNDLSITDDVCCAMVMALKKNINLARLYMDGSPPVKNIWNSLFKPFNITKPCRGYPLEILIQYYLILVLRIVEYYSSHF